MPEEDSMAVLATGSAGGCRDRLAHSQMHVMLQANQDGTVSLQTVGRLSSVIKNRAGCVDLGPWAVRRIER